jgi:hypothetical protein
MRHPCRALAHKQEGFLNTNGKTYCIVSDSEEAVCLSSTTWLHGGRAPKITGGCVVMVVDTHPDPGRSTRARGVVVVARVALFGDAEGHMHITRCRIHRR